MLCITIVLVKFTSVALLAVTLIKCQLKCADGLCVSIHAWQIRTLAGFVPWAAQLGFSMSSSACHDLGKRSFIPKNPNEKRINSLFFTSQYIATEWVINKTIEYCFFRVKTIIITFSLSVTPALDNTRSYFGQSRVAAEHSALLSPQTASFCSCAWCDCRNDTLEEVVVSVRIRDWVVDSSSQRFPTPTLGEDEELLSLLSLPALPGIIYPPLMHYKILA